ncbi:MAG TPA: hypothetical protein VFQ81_09860 [Candidatus Limnocylindria bacterium]|nr:hypothetical protein [Candidatus Limnocylindria bacterium]
MSREERRAYERMNRGRDPFAPPVNKQAQQRMERAKQRRAAKRATSAPASGLGGRFIRWALLGFVLIGLLAFSVSWPQGMPNALYIGLAAGLGWVVLAFVGRALVRRSSAAGGAPKR